LEIGEIFHIFPSGTGSMGARGSKKAYTRARTGIYLRAKFGCDRSIVVGCRPSDDRQTNKQTSKHPGMTIRPTLRDVTQQAAWLNSATQELAHYFALFWGLELLLDYLIYTSGEKYDVHSCSATPSSNKGDDILCISRLVIEIPILGYLGFSWFGGI